MKELKMLVFVGIILITTVSFAQKKEVYNPNANAEEDIASAVISATKAGKHIFLQIGGNWCPWCIKFHEFVESDAELKAYVSDNFEVVKVNYDRDNRNEELLAKLGFPQRFGFPVFVILDGQGNRIHTQNSVFLEKEQGYDRETVLSFFKHWSPQALNPELYQK